MARSTARICRSLLCVLCSVWFAASAWADNTQTEPEQSIANACDALMAAHRDGDVKMAQRVLDTQATWINADGKEARPAIKIINDRKAKLAKDSSAPFSVEFVASRQIRRLGSTAIVQEILKTTGVPLRRTTTLALNQAEWQILQVHNSRYDRWEKDIQAFEKSDERSTPQRDGVVFVGSSSIRKWDSIEDDFAGMHVVQRGFGGSQMIDALLYAKRLIIPYKPRAIVVYEGDNDIGSGKSPDRVIQDFRKFVDVVRADLPEVNIGFIAIKPSLKRWELWPQMQVVNEQVRQIALQDPKITFLDIATPMLEDSSNGPKPELFADDGLHLSPTGYAIWTTVVKRWLED